MLDEPTACLTAAESRQLFEQIDALRSSGRAILLVSHRIDEVLAHCDRVVVLRDGVLVGQVPTSAVDKEALLELIVGSDVELGHAEHLVESEATVLVVDELDVGSGRKLSFNVRRGEILGLAGPVGAGHEDVAQALFGLTGAIRGRCSLNGQPYVPTTPVAAIAAGIAYVPADRHAHGIAGRLTATENLYLNPSMRGRGTGRRAERNMARAVLSRFGVRPLDPDAEMDTFSGGNAQRVLLARWLDRTPDLALLCEPTAGVDVGARASIYALIRQRSEAGTAFLIVSSDFDELSHLCSRTIIFRRNAAPHEFHGPTEAWELTAAALGG